MRLRSALTGICVVGLALAAAPSATAADEPMRLALTVTGADGVAQSWSATATPGAGAELVAGGGEGCALRASVDVDPAARTITVEVTRPAGAVDVSLAVAGGVGGLVAVTPGASADLHVAVTPEVALLSWHAAGDQCTTSRAVAAYTAPGQPLPAEPDGLSGVVEQTTAGVTATAPVPAPATGAVAPAALVRTAPAATAVTADPSFTG